MSDRDFHPTPYDDVNAILRTLLSSLQVTLGEHLVGLYLYGSLVSGDFDPKRSDIDFVAVTKGDLPDGLITALETMHQRIWTGGLKWAAKLEGSYIPKNALWRYSPTDGPRPTINEGKFYLARHGYDWIIQRHIVREHGVVLAGPPPVTLIAPVTPDDLRRAVRGLLADWWAYLVKEHSERFSSWEYQAYAVLTMCRTLYTLQHGAMASKPVSARWALTDLDPRWKTLVEQALDLPPDAQNDRFDDVLEFVRYILEATC